MDTLYIATSILFFLWIIRNVISQVALWQLKEYRFDRIFIHLRETRQGKSILFSPLSFVKWIFIIGYVFVAFNESFLFTYYLGIVSIYLLLSILVLRENFLNLQKQPVYTPKALFIIIVSLSIIFTLYSFPLMDKFLWLLLMDKLSYFIVGIIIFALSFPTEVFRDLQIAKARQKLKKFKKLLVIGVTGSYGKSSTKDYVAQILKEKFSVVKTKGTNNTPIGIAQTILHDLTSETDIFVVEMGAYKKGEISDMCDMVHPKIGILTAVNDQHLSLFGSLENTKKAKYELIESLPRDGTALFNGNGDVVDLYMKTKKNKVLYSTYYGKDLSQGEKQGIFASNIHVKKRSVVFRVTIGESSFQLEAPLIGGHNIENILPGIFLAHLLGMNEQQIKRAVMYLSPISKTMIYHALQNGVTIIDDTFNANPDAVIAALRYAKIFKGKKILVLQPMIELGKRSMDEHYRVALEAGKVCDALFLTNKNFYSAILRGIDESGGKCEVRVVTSQLASDYLSEYAKKDDVVVFEGKEAAYVLEKLL